MGSMTPEIDPLLFTKELVKSEYVLSTKAVMSAKTRLRNAKDRQKSINRVMLELGYEVGSNE
ncbi:MAG: hypothetical protein KAR20_03460 [Candidatus Heimdallarchaeota archaeon]|nr:hypothetical protein [Candidatus Heimdallarchaeota archaeon]